MVRDLISTFLTKLRHKLKATMPPQMLVLYRCLRNLTEVKSLLSFVAKRNLGLSLGQRVAIGARFFKISCCVECAHIQSEAISFMEAVLSLPKDVPGCVVEAGAFKGGGTAKFSIGAEIANRELVVFDSFGGLPENSEGHDKDIYGRRARFSKGDFCGSLAEVKSTVSKFGSLRACRFIEGWFDDTMPNFTEPVAAVYLDVDLARSTRSCLKYLYPLLVPGGVLFSQDGHLRLVLEVFEDEEFWENEVGCPRPCVERVSRNLIRITKPVEPELGRPGCYEVRNQRSGVEVAEF